MNPTLEIFSQGEEIVSGQVVDTNAAWLSEQAVRLGFTVTRHTAVGDNLEDLIELLTDITRRADCCICTGGLGPTCDDLTTEAVARAFSRSLRFDDMAFAQIQRFFASRDRPMPESNRKQAMLPEGAVRIDNDFGTAPGFSLQQQRCWFVFLPGVPSEMRGMYLQKVLSQLSSRFSFRPNRQITLKTVGLGESDIQQRIGAIDLPPEVRLGFRAGGSDVEVKLLFPAGYPEAAEKNLLSEIAGRLGDSVFAVNRPGDPASTLPAVLDKMMTEGKYTLAVLETASQGLLAAKCQGLPWLLEAHYQQSLDRVGQRWAVHIDTGDLPETAKALAAALQNCSEADIVLVQLYAGDYRQFHDQNQRITLVTVLHHGERVQQSSHTLAGPPERKQNQAALLSLDLLRRYLQPPLSL